MSAGHEVRAGSPLAELHFRLLERLGPPSILVDRRYDVLHISPSAAHFLRLTGGEPTTNLLKLVPAALRSVLTAALAEAAATGAAVAVPGRVITTDGGAAAESRRSGVDAVAVDVRVVPMFDVGTGFLLVMLTATEAPARPAPGPAVTGGGQLEQLTRELLETRGKAELLETGRVALQASHDALTAANTAMGAEVEELARAYATLQNLMAATSIATVFLDGLLRVTRYTPSAADLFHLIPSDMGRPLSHVTHCLEYPELFRDAGLVLANGTPIERETRSGGRWFLARVLPYRTVEDRVAGVVLTFFDITERKHTDESLRAHVEELTRFNVAVVGRELRMVELKQQVNRLARRLGEPPPYPSVDDAEQNEAPHGPGGARG
jgi:two-component system CheB/CheR fusion protein